MTASADDPIAQVRTAVADVLRDEVAPDVRRWEDAGAVPDGLARRLGSLDLLGVGLPEPDGSGLGTPADVVLIEEVARTWGALAATILPGVALAPALRRDAGIWARLGRSIVAGETLVAAVLDDVAPDGSAVGRAVNGQRAGVMVALAAVGPARVVLADDGGWTAEPVALDGMRAADVADVTARPSTGQALDADPEIVRHRMHLLIAAMAVGLTTGALDLANRYATERVQFGQPIARFGEIYAMLSDASARLAAARALVAAVASGDPDTSDAVRAHLFCAEVACDVTSAAQHVHGGYGHMAEYEVGRFARDARWCRAALGGREAQLGMVAVRSGLTPAPSGGRR